MSMRAECKHMYRLYSDVCVFCEKRAAISWLAAEGMEVRCGNTIQNKELTRFDFKNIEVYVGGKKVIGFADAKDITIKRQRRCKKKLKV